jgi:hypothetical protein
MKKLSFLSAMLLVLVSVFATDTPAYAPHSFHAGFHPVYGHMTHKQPVRSGHKHMRPVASFVVHGSHWRAMGVMAETPALVQISLPDFAEADASMDVRATIDLTEISIPGFADADADMVAAFGKEL